MKNIIEYIKEKYLPNAIILYGSYADGTNNQDSDFDALIISDKFGEFHDTSLVDGIQLDVFVYPTAFFEDDFDCNGFIQIFGGTIIEDSCSKGQLLMEKVTSYINGQPKPSQDDIDASVAWCNKMLLRTKRTDAEGLFRWHWLLIDSLEIFFNVIKQPYMGPKKSIRWLEANRPAAFDCYKTALESFDMDSLESWISLIKSTNTQSR